MSSLRIPAAQVIEAIALTQALKSAVPDVNGLTVLPGAVEVRSLPGVDFTPQDIALLTSLVQAHNGAALLAARAQRIREAQAELATTTVKTLTVSQVDAAIDSLSSLADLKTFLKKLVRYLIAQQQARG